MAPRKSTTTKTPSKRAGTSKVEIGGAAPISGAAGFGSNGHSAMAPASGVATHAQIEFRAYEIFLARGGAHSDDLADWFKAERELNVLAAKPHPQLR
jgi:hypothetical protein